MKRKLLVLVVFVLCIATLASCKVKNKNDGGNDGGNSGATAEPEKGIIYDRSVSAHIISNYKSTNDPEDSHDYLLSLADHIYEVAGYTAYILEDTGVPDSHEIIIGDTDREITATAKALLEQKIRKKTNSLEEDLPGWDKIVGYAVYSDGNSVAIVWSDFQLEEAAIRYFAENFILTDSLALEPGYIKTELFNLEAFLAERSIEVLNRQWDELGRHIPSQYSEEIVKSLQALYNLYDIDMVRWLANLYDPQVVIVDSQGNPVPEYNQEGNVIYGGGWYHSNSGRDNEGFLPDIENTYVALEFVASTGMAEMFGDNWVPAMPEWLKTQVGLWFQNLQDPDTFFYHPQWPKEYINANGLQSRITRDRGSARTTLSKLGFAQLYPTVAATSNPGLPGKLNGSSAVVAASKVVATAEMLWQYQSAENFAEYIKGLEKEVASYNDPNARAGRFYAYGNLFQSTTGYINANPQIRQMVIDFFNKYQNPENGTWADVLCYNATNGIHKIGAVYNAIGAKMNYVDQMIESVIEIVGWTVDEKPIGAGVDLYNAWSCFPYIYTNVRKHDPDGASKIQAIKDRVFASAGELIMTARDQIAGFRRPDGSYGYSRTGSCPTAQGAPVALAGYNEGDVNGNAIASLNVIEYILYALELGDYMVDMFTEYERMEFVHILNNLGPVIKGEEELGEDIIHTFEDIPDDELPNDYSADLDSGRSPIPDTFAKVTNIDGNRVLEVVAKHRGTDDNGRNLSLRAPIYLVKKAANMALIEFDICILSEGTTAGSSLIQFNIAGSGSPVLYPYFGVDGAGNVYIANANVGKIGNIGKLDEKISLRVEYFWNDGVYRIYANDIYIGGGNDTYNNRNHQEVQSITLGAPSTATVHYWLDNVRMLRTVKEYVDESKAAAPNHSFTGTADGTPVKGFLDNGVLLVPYGGSANYAGEGETLELHGSGNGTALAVTIPAYTAEGIIPNTAKASLEFKLSSLLGGTMNVALLGKGGSIITGIGFAESADGTQIIGSHYSADLLTSFCSFYIAENADGQDEITLEVTYSYDTGIMKVKIGDEVYTAIAGKVEGFSGIKIFLDGAESLVELDEAYIENIYEEPTEEEIKVDPNYEDFERGHTEVCEEWVCTHTSHTGSPEQTVTNLYFPTGVNAVFNPEVTYSNTHGAIAQVLADAVTGNKYVNIVAPKRISSRDRAHNYVINAQNCVLSPDVFIVETDMKLDSVLPDGSASHSTYLQITLTNTVDNKYVRFDLDANAAKVVIAGVELADWDTWFKFKIEYYPAQGVIQLYADGAYKGELTNGDAASSSSETGFGTLGSQVNKISFSGANSSSAGFSINFDNSAMYSSNKEYVGGREPEIIYPDGPSYETFDQVLDSGGVGNLITGATGTTVSYTGATNEGGAQAFLRVDEAIGNSFVTIYSSGRVNGKDRSHGVNVPIVTLSGDANMIALEADLFLDSRSVSKDFVQILFAHGKNNANHGQLNMSLKDGAAYFGGVKVGYVDEWFTLRFEFYLDVGKLKVYNGDIYLGEIEKFSQTDSSNPDKLVSELKEISTVAINTMNNSGLFYLGVDNAAAYTIAKEYVAETAGTLPAPNPTPDTFVPNPPTDPEEPTDPDDPTDPDNPTDPDEPDVPPVDPDAPVGDDDVDIPDVGGDIPGVVIPGDEDVKDDNTDEWTQ